MLGEASPLMVWKFIRLNSVSICLYKLKTVSTFITVSNREEIAVPTALHIIMYNSHYFFSLCSPNYQVASMYHSMSKFCDFELHRWQQASLIIHQIILHKAGAFVIHSHKNDIFGKTGDLHNKWAGRKVLPISYFKMLLE